MMATDSLSYKRLRVQRPEPPSSPPAQTFFSISPPKRPQHPYEALSTNNRNRSYLSETRRTREIQAIFDPETEYDSYPLRYGIPRSSWAARRARRPLAQALEQTQLVRHQTGTELGVGVVATTPRGDSILSALLRRPSLHQQQQYCDNDKANNEEIYGDLRDSTHNVGNGSDMLHQNQENRVFKKRSSSSYSIFKDDSEVVPQVNHRNAARTANDDYEECDGLDKDQGYDQNQDLLKRVAKDRGRRGQASTTAISMDYDDDDDLLDLALDLEQGKFHDRCLDFDEMKQPAFHTLYEDTTLSNLRGALKSLTIVGISVTAAVYLLLLTYKLAADLYVFVAIQAVLTLLRWTWTLVVVWSWRLLLWTVSGAYHLFLMALWPSRDTLAMAICLLLMYTLRRIRRNNPMEHLRRDQTIQATQAT